MRQDIKKEMKEEEKRKKKRIIGDTLVICF